MRVERIDWDGADASALAARLRALQPALGEVSERGRARSSTRVRDGRRRGGARARGRASADGEIAGDLRVDPEDAISTAPARSSREVRDALRDRRREHRARSPRPSSPTSPPRSSSMQGQSVEVREVPVAAAGVYAPGGRGRLPVDRC